MARMDIAAERYRIGDLVVDAGRRCVSRNGNNIRLPKLSFKLLLALIHSAPNLQSNEALLATVWERKIVGPETVRNESSCCVTRSAMTHTIQDTSNSCGEKVIAYVSRSFRSLRIRQLTNRWAADLACVE